MSDITAETVADLAHVTAHKYGIGELSDLTLVVAAELTTHHFLVHKAIFATHSNYFKAQLIGDPAVTTMLLPDIFGKHLAGFEWLLTKWYAVPTQYITDAQQAEVHEGNTVVWKNGLYTVTAIHYPTIDIRSVPTKGDSNGRGNKQPVLTVNTSEVKVRRELDVVDSVTRFAQAKQLLPLAQYLDCPVLVAECKELIRQMLQHALRPNVHVSVEQLIECLGYADKLKLTGMVATVITQLSRQLDALNQYHAKHPAWLEELSAECLRLLLSQVLPSAKQW